MRVTPKKVWWKWKALLLRVGYPGMQVGRGLQLDGKILKKGRVRVRVHIAREVAVTRCLVISGDGKVNIDAGSRFGDANGDNPLETCCDRAVLTVGPHCYLSGARISARIGIRIGNRCRLSECQLKDSDFHHVGMDRHTNNATLRDAEIVFGNNVWVSNKALVLKGVKVGDNSVVGAGAVVRKEVPANVEAIGNTQVVVKHLGRAAGGVG